MPVRKSPRRQFERQVGVLYEGVFELCRARQIGEGGMLVACARELAIGAHLVLSFFIPGQACVVVRAEVRNSNRSEGADAVSENVPAAYGVLFHNLSPEHKRKIRYYAASQAPTEQELKANVAMRGQAPKAQF